MHSTSSSILAAGKKLCELKVPHMGVTMPVNVYAALIEKNEPFMLCVCYEDSPIETRLYLNKNSAGDWIELYEGYIDLARIIGPMIETELKPVINN